MKILMLAALGVVLAACSGYPIVRNPDDPDGQSHGSVVPLSTHFPADPSMPIRVIFIHGVNDTCPGYALDATNGWLNTETLQAVHLVPADDKPAIPQYVTADQFIDNKAADLVSRVAYARRDFVYTIGDKSYSVQGIEITWSLLTQWVKNKQLGYDLTEPVQVGPNDKCIVQPPDHARPRPRVILNEQIKERLFDRALADALLYSGTYGVVIQRGVAEALCRALGGAIPPGGTRCRWPEPSTDNANYIFVTHSLGSRISYDVLLGLYGDTTNPNGVFTPAEQQQAKPFISQLMARTPAIYMMANQVPLVGLAYMSITQGSSDPPVPLLAVQQRLEGLKQSVTLPAAAPALERGVASTAPVSFTHTRAGDPCNGIVATFSGVRQAEAKRREEKPTLEIIAFSDPNDDLSWGIPSWYMEHRECFPDTHVTNVFVGNSTRWVFVENPVTAHTDYFKNPDVWKVMHCGAVDGKLQAC
jgi:hypothetical protein